MRQVDHPDQCRTRRFGAQCTTQGILFASGHGEDRGKIKETPARVVCQVLVALIAKVNVCSSLCEQDFRVVCILQSVYCKKNVDGRVISMNGGPSNLQLLSWCRQFRSR
jgi:hypothetical protein